MAVEGRYCNHSTVIIVLSVTEYLRVYTLFVIACGSDILAINTKTITKMTVRTKATLKLK